ncbi:MAG: hypothetical protein Tsb002_11420 [Wenzhouxiangellaceae bacterium]
MSAGDEQFTATISEVQRMTRHGDSEREPFSVLLSVADTDRFYEQQIFTFDHGQLGRFELFMVPLGPQGQGMVYEAVFT